jgi:hypothetical protein
MNNFSVGVINEMPLVYTRIQSRRRRKKEKEATVDGWMLERKASVRRRSPFENKRSGVPTGRINAISIPTHAGYYLLFAEIDSSGSSFLRLSVSSSATLLAFDVTAAQTLLP